MDKVLYERIVNTAEIVAVLMMVVFLLLVVISLRADAAGKGRDTGEECVTGYEMVSQLVYLGEDPSGEFVMRTLVDPAGIERVLDRFDVCPMGEASVGNEVVIDTVLKSDFAVQVWIRDVERPMVLYFSFTDEVVVLAPDGWCAVSERPMMDTEAVRNEFWRKEGGWNACIEQG